jgi:hypothetical protein
VKLTSAAYVTLSSELVGEIVEQYLKNQGYNPTGPSELNVYYNTASGAGIGFDVVTPVAHKSVVEVNVGGLSYSIPVINDTDRGEE